MTFSTTELRAILNALQCAADVYANDAARAGMVGADRMEKGYRELTAEARQLAARIKAEIG